MAPRKIARPAGITVAWVSVLHLRIGDQLRLSDFQGRVTGHAFNSERGAVTVMIVTNDGGECTRTFPDHITLRVTRRA